MILAQQALQVWMPLEVENCQLVNIYKDKNAFVNEFGHQGIFSISGDHRESQIGCRDCLLSHGGTLFQVFRQGSA